MKRAHPVGTGGGLSGYRTRVIGLFAVTRSFCPRVECARSAFEAGLDVTSPILQHFTVKALLQTGSSGRVPVPPEE